MSNTVLHKLAEFFRPQIPLWACEFTSRHIIAAGINRGRDRVQAAVAEEIPQGMLDAGLHEPNIVEPEVARRKVEEALRKVGFKGSEIAVVVPDDTARISVLSVDSLPRNPEEKETFIRWKFKKSIPFDIDNAQFAWSVLATRKDGLDLLVALSPRSVINEYEKVMETLELHPGMVIPSTVAALNLLTPAPGDSLFVKLMPDCITTSIFQNRQLKFYRRVQHESLYGAVYPTLMYYQDKLGGTQVNEVVICGYDSGIRALMDELHEKIAIPVRSLGSAGIEDIFKPALGAVGFS